MENVANFILMLDVSSSMMLLFALADPEVGTIQIIKNVWFLYILRNNVLALYTQHFPTKSKITKSKAGFATFSCEYNGLYLYMTVTVNSKLIGCK